MDFYRSALGQFFATSAGRVTRVERVSCSSRGAIRSCRPIVGIVLIVIGLVPLLAGLSYVCAISTLFGGPFQGAAIREAGKK